MSVVWRGFDEILGRHVAVKVLSPQLAGDDSFRERLRQEALAAARLCHPHITCIFDFGESLLSRHLTVPYVVMELNDGESLAARLARQGPLSWRDAVVVGTEVGSALATAHARGVVHRDITPANVMLTSTGSKVVDFGISALVGQRDSAPDGSLLGTPAYLAPERLGGGQVSPATDVYALGLLLYRSLTGRLPWPAETTTEALRAHLYADPEPVPPIPGMPDEVATLCLRCLAKRPADRPGAAEVARSLGALVGLRASISPLESAAPAGPAFGLRPTERIPAARRGMPAGRPQNPAAVLRLRAGLRIGTALHLGGPQPLGGGLFAGGRLGLHHDAPHPGRPAFAGRHRMQAAVATVTLLIAVGVSWSASREPDQVGPAQAAAAGAGPTVPRTTGCKVRYQVKHDNGEDFDALLTVLNTGRRSLAGWQVEFDFPGTQRLVDLPRTVDQNGHRVLLRTAGKKRLKPGETVTVPLRGAYRDRNPMPLSFDLNGHKCDVEVLGPTTITPPATAAGPARQGKTPSAHSAKRADHRSPPKHHHQQKPKTPKTKAKPKPTSSTPRPARIPAKPGGFSLAV
jgi:serine/threonine-protein kinase